jgi:sugar phosphate permease
LIRSNRALIWTIAAGAFSTFGSNGMMQWLPMFFIRSHHLGIAKIGLYFGPLLAGGMTVGMLAGGVIGNRFAKRAVSDLAWICACTVLATVPLFGLMLWVRSSSVALGLMFLGMAVIAAFSPNYTSAWQTICDPRARGSCGGVSGFVGALVASALCPFAVGALSDFWAPTFGADSLRYALMVSMAFILLGSGLFAVSGRLIARRAAVWTGPER